jgi:lycopene beta-cyclase
MTESRTVDLVVIGDGPAGSALAAACSRRGLEVVLAGPDEPWSATYCSWIDDLDAVEGIAADAVFSMRVDSIAVHADRSVELDRAYGVYDNTALSGVLRAGYEHARARVVDATDGRRVVLDDGSVIRAGIVVDASGWPSKFAKLSDTTAPAWQTAIGVVLAEPPMGDLGRATFMDFRSPGAGGRPSSIGPHGVTTFCYSLPVPDGWLVEETVLAARPAIEPIALLARLAARLGRHPDDLLADAVRTEYVRIPMGGAHPDADQPVVAFGAAAGYVHAATGFSVASSLRAAGRVADAIASTLASTAPDPSIVAEAVWPVALRRSRLMHDYGLELLLRLDDDAIREFFGAFFALPQAQWSGYLRIDTPPAEVAAVMSALFKSSSWSMRRRLMAGNPTTLARLLRP